MHGFPGTETVVDIDGRIGHGAVLHGCYVGVNAMVGMGAVVMDNGRIGESSIVGGCAFVKADAKFPARSLIVGTPAKRVRALSDADIAWKRRGTAATRCLRCAEGITAALHSSASLGITPGADFWTGTRRVFHGKTDRNGHACVCWAAYERYKKG